MSRAGRMLRRAAMAVIALSATTGLLAGCFLAPGLPPGPSRAPATDGVPSELQPYYGQTLAWEPCEGDGFDCATVTAPRDWADPTAGDLELALIRHRPADGTPSGSLLTNPGGPGASGYDFLRSAVSSQFTDALRDAYDIVGFDPRGVGRSTPVECLDDAATDDYLFDVPDAERGSPEWEAELTRESEMFAAACEANSDGILPYISTESAARDLDLLRAVLGDDVLNYIGFSWGTTLGAVYADLFPARVGRMVLDGALDPSVPASQVGALQAIGFEDSLRAFAEECSADEGCVYRGSADDVVADIGALLARLDRSPLPTADERELGADTMLTAIIAALYSRGSWPVLRVALAQVEEGDTTMAMQLADSYYARTAEGYRDNSAEAFAAYNCVSYPAESPDAEEAATELLEREAPTVAPYWFGVDTCASWPAPPVAESRRVTAEGAAPIVVVGTTGDPATPYEWAVSLADELTSAVLVTRVGEGHTGFNQGNTCVDDAVETYLLEGAAPASDLRCE